jgi:colanic acid biosynthesis glycosyl transferase WcaI
MKILLLNQCFYPDVVSSAQHLTDLALGLAAQGHDVTVVASSRGYDDPTRRFRRREKWKGVTIRRIGCTGFGKKSRWRRAVDFGSFMLNCAVRVLLLPRFDLVVAMTSPPLISFLAALLVKLKGGRFVLWVMDLNPDEAIAAGWLKEQSAIARLLHALMQYSLKRADRIIVLDRFVSHRIISRGIDEEKTVVLPPWSHDDVIRYDHEGRTKFRAVHNLSDKCVVMYSGNHSPCHPLDTLLAAAQSLAGNDEIVFCFVGGGSEMEKVKASVAANKLSNVLCLGYQPLDELSRSLSAADLHVVVMGDSFVGIAHPCKIYNILQVGAPVLYIGPSDSHISDIFSGLAERHVTFSASHGDVDSVVRQILTAAAMRNREAKTRAPASAALAFSKEAILPRLIESLCAPLGSQAACGSSIPDSEGRAARDARTGLSSSL